MTSGSLGVGTLTATYRFLVSFVTQMSTDLFATVTE